MDWECCWTKEEITPEECPYITGTEQELYHSLRRRVAEKCLECPRFTRDMERLKEADHPFSHILPHIIDEFLSQKAQIHSVLTFLDTRNREIKFLHELSLVLQTSMDLDEVLSVAMTAITAGKGFGMNRAFLLLADKERRRLKGYLGVGPRTYEEAWRIWEDIGRNNVTLKEMARNFYDTKLTSERIKFREILELLDIPMEERNHILNRALLGRKPILVENAFRNPAVDRALADILGVDSFLIMPLISRNRRIGVIIADNCITHKPITQQDMQSLETFAFPVAFAIERASLYERLQEELDKVTAASVKLQEQQELIVKMEKMALVGKITSNIAHSIRNPLLIIGGFARSLLKNAAPGDPNRDPLESIVREAKQLEEALNEVLAYSDSLYPAMDMWDVNQLVTTVREELRTSLEQGGVDCTLDLAPELPMAYVDYRQFTYCLKNIMKNALEALPGGGQLALKTRPDAGFVVVEVRDNRPETGLETHAAATDQLFSTREVGSGLGLSLCKTILEKHGAHFALEHPAEGGARCSMRLPTSKEEIPHV